MRKQLKDLIAVNDYVTQNTPGLKIWEENWNGMMCAHHIIPGGTDFGNMLKGLPDDMCGVTHWGYCFKGRMKMIYKDSEEIVGPGDIFCMPAPHGCIVLEDTDFIQFSTADEMHGQGKLAGEIAAKRMQK